MLARSDATGVVCQEVRRPSIADGAASPEERQAASSRRRRAGRPRTGRDTVRATIQHERNRIRGVRGQRVALRIDLLFRVPVVGRDRDEYRRHRAPLFRAVRASTSSVSRLEIVAFHHARMTDHVGVRVIHRRSRRAGDRRCLRSPWLVISARTHFGREVVRRDRYDSKRISIAVFARRDTRLATAVEEVGDVRVFLRFRERAAWVRFARGDDTASPNVSPCGRGPKSTGFVMSSSYFVIVAKMQIGVRVDAELL